MGGEISTIQSLKAVDAWIDVINANINGGVRTAFKSSRLTFSGSNVDIQHAGNSASLPLQFPEPGLQTANTIIDFTQGAITASTENTHLAIQGEGFFLLASPDLIETTAGASFGWTKAGVATAKFYLTRDGEFRTDQNGFLRASNGFYLVTAELIATGGRQVLYYNTGTGSTSSSGIRAIYNNLDMTGTAPTGRYVPLTNFLQNGPPIVDAGGFNMSATGSLLKATLGKQSLRYSSYGSTVFDFGYQTAGAPSTIQLDASITLDYGKSSDATILTKSLEASNSSMTQSVPELSLAQKLFSALTKVLQTKQTNVDGVLNLVR